MSDPDNGNGIQLARIEGKIDVTNERLSNVQTDIIEIRSTQRDHGSRLGLLESKENIRYGERKGVALSGKLGWSIISLFAGGGGVFTVLELLK